jgi:outer membrane scaffolding protein for murein synthesis (MipA/OmpV family)
LACLVLAATPVTAESILDAIRSYDMNDYSLGVAVASRQNPYIGGENGTIAYPYLTSFTDDSLSDSWFIIRDGGYGIRWITDNDWELGAIGRLRTLGLGNSKAEELVGIADRKWTIELGPTIGYRRWPLQIHYTYWAEVTGRHGGNTNDLTLSYPFDTRRGFVVPRIRATYESAQHTRYYFSVSEAEATPTRPAYAPGSHWNYGADLRIGYELSPKWLLTTTIGVEFLGSEARNSPIVGRDKVWFGNVGLAHNADVFNPTAFDNFKRQLPTFDIRVGAFFNNISTTIKQETANGIPGFEIELEDVLGVADTGTAIEVDALWRIGQHHRLELGYFELVRNSTTVTDESLVVGSSTYNEGSVVNSTTDYSSLRFTYTFFLMRDSQKELGVTAGLHLTDLATNISSDEFPDVQKTQSSLPLPVIGLNGAVFLGEKTTLRARVHIFRTDFDQVEGSLNYAALDVERRIGDKTWIGIGYNYYGTNLTSRDDGVTAGLEVRHHGPVAFFTVGF